MSISTRNGRWAVCAVLAALALTSAWVESVAQGGQAAAGSQPAAASKIGTIKSIHGNTLVLKTDASGPDLTVTVQDSARIVQLPPGSKDMKTATPMQFKDVQVGDRMLVRGTPAASGDSLAATLVVVMKGADLAQKQQQELQDWQKRGAGGIVSAVDSAGGSIIVAVTPTVNFSVKTSKDTVFLRYAPNSIQFADAQKGAFDQIKPGDQLRARGNRSADGKELAAEEVISGTFRNIAGTITALDASAGTVTVKDILAKKSVVVRLTGDSQMRKLPPQLAMRIAFFLKGAPDGATPAGAGGPANAPNGGNRSGAPAGGPPERAGPGPRPGGGAPDFQQMVSRLPAVTVADLEKDEAVMIVSTAGTGGSEVTAITLLSGVEPILTASPNGMGAAALLSNWNLSAPGGGEGGPQ